MTSQPDVANPFINADLTQATTNVKGTKDGWVAKQLRQRESAFASFDTMRLFVGTWNVNGNDVTEDLLPWLRTAAGEDPDLFVLGFQELDLSTEAYIISDKTKEDDWCYAIASALEPLPSNYVKVTSKQLIGMLVVIYAKSTHAEHITEVSTESVGTGILGLMGNKGAVGCRLRLYDSYLTFVNSHLAADTGQVDRRNQDFAEICRRLQFMVPQQYGDYRSFIFQNPWLVNTFDINGGGGFGTQNLSAIRQFTGIYDSDHLIWLGDLNYRVNLSDTDAKSMIEEKRLSELFAYDQLMQEKAAKKVFVDFEEPPVDFPPTYKFDVGTSRYDTSEKRRAPSWCDRIQWFRNPLRSNNQAWIRKVDPVRLGAAKEEMERELDRFENDAIPVIAINVNSVEFGTVQFMKAAARVVELRNVGQAQKVTVSKPWCFVNPPGGSLRPGESLQVKVEILVNEGKIACPLNFAEDTLEDLLILHVDNGKDYFIAVNATWQPSCFGNDVATLCRAIKPIAAFTPMTLRALMIEVTTFHSSTSVNSVQQQTQLIPLADTPSASSITSSTADTSVGASSEALSIPKEVWRLIDFLFRFGMDVENLFLLRGDPEVMEYLRACLDTGEAFDIETLVIGRPSSEDSQKLPQRPSASGDAVDAELDDVLRKASVLDDDDGSTVASAAASTACVRPGAPPKGKVAAAHSAAQTLLDLLAGFRDPVIPCALYGKCVGEGYLSFFAARQCVRSMPEPHYHLLKYVCSFLAEVVASFGPAAGGGGDGADLDKLAPPSAPESNPKFGIQRPSAGIERDAVGNLDGLYGAA
ncbi:hypothetical protein HK101_005090 [Irineochytrium annulatum]|nr:hypothetical protein HK101_005090 [Irineochytrium annulatum]